MAEDFNWIQNTRTNIFTVNNKVYTKHTGLPQVGTIIGMWPAISYYSMLPPDCVSRTHAMYRKYDEQWLEKYIYLVKFDEPSKTISYTEFKNHNPEIKEEFLITAYDDLPNKEVATYAEFDLGLLID